MHREWFSNKLSIYLYYILLVYCFLEPLVQWDWDNLSYSFLNCDFRSLLFPDTLGNFPHIFFHENNKSDAKMERVTTHIARCLPWEDCHLSYVSLSLVLGKVGNGNVKHRWEETRVKFKASQLALSNTAEIIEQERESQNKQETVKLVHLSKWPKTSFVISVQML